MQSLNILITNIFLCNMSGTEMVVRDLALQLKQLGHFPMVYSPDLGEVAQIIQSAGIPTVNDLSLLPRKPHIIHGHHHLPTLQALLYFNDVPGIYVCHDPRFYGDFPPYFNRIMLYIAVSHITLERLINEACIPEEVTQIVHNAVDTNLFRQRSSLPHVPKRALFFSNYPENWSQISAFQKACKKCGISLDGIGLGFGKTITDPENILGDYDIVFAVGKCALEALAVGCAVIPSVVKSNSQVIGDMISSQNVEECQLRNFAQCMKYSARVKNIVNQIRKYDVEDAAKVTKYIRDYSNINQAVEKYLTIYQRALSQWENERVQCQDSFIDYANHQITLLNHQTNLLKIKSPLFDINEMRQLRRSPGTLPPYLKLLSKIYYYWHSLLKLFK